MARGRRPQRGSREQLDVVVKELGEGAWTPGLTVLTGQDLYHLDAAQKAIIAALVPVERSGFDLTVFGDSVETSTVVAAARSVGMFTQRRVVLLRDIDALDGAPDALEEFASNPPRDGYLIVRAPKLDRRRKLHQILAKSGRLLEFADGDDDPARSAREISRLATEKGIKLNRDAALLLAELTEGDYYRADAELEKLTTWAGDESPRAFGVNDVQRVAVGATHLDVWKLADALLQRDRAGALTALRDVIRSGEEPLRVLGALAFRVRGMIHARTMIAAGTPASSAMRSARLWGSSHNEMARGLARYEVAELLEFPRLMLEADTTLKSRAISPVAVLERMVDRMTGPSSGART